MYTPKHFFKIALLVPFLFWGDYPTYGQQSTPAKKSYGDIVKNSDLKDGLFHLYTDRDDGTVYLGIKNSQLDQEFIHFGYVLDGVPEVGIYRGRFLGEKIFIIRKHFDRLEFVVRNTSFYFDPENALSRAAEANISDAVIASLKIVATTEDKTTYLLRADELFLREIFAPIKSIASRHDSPSSTSVVLGDLSSDRTRFNEIRNYPENSLLRVQYIYENKSPKQWGEDDVTDARFLTIEIQHSLIAVPKNDFKPRFDDPRVGYFTSSVSDLTSKKSANYRDPIHRWHLKKKNPSAAKSDPVEPITWWIENTTPVELRDTIQKAVESWNRAFGSAGFTNAIVCKIQPDDAKWDAGDIRYNVLRWTSSPNPPFGGYGPSFVNPRTGQILGADIMLEYVYLTNRLRLRDLITRTEHEDAISLYKDSSDPHSFCQAGLFLQESSISAQASLATAAASAIEMDALMNQTLANLILHEVGHTLGLNHNFRSSYLLTPEELQDKEVTSKRGVSGSVMDYVPANVSLDREKQTLYYSVAPGPYDHWAIRYGYTETTDEKEATTLEAILAESTKPENAFGNDADDMRSTGRGIDPRAMLFDLSSDPIAHAITTMERVKKTLSVLPDKFPTQGESYQEFLTAYTTLMRDYERASTILSRYVGGVYVDRSVVGQAGAANPYTPVPAADQERALNALKKYVFAPKAFSFLTPKLLSHLQIQRRGFEIRKLKDNEDPKIHATVATIQNAALNQLLHAYTLSRIEDSTLYGNTLPLPKVMKILDSSIMEGEIDSFRAALQVNYIERLIRIAALGGQNSFPSSSRAEAVAALETHLPPGEGGTSHDHYLRRIISRALDAR